MRWSFERRPDHDSDHDSHHDSHHDTHDTHDDLKSRPPAAPSTGGRVSAGKSFRLGALLAPLLLFSPRSGGAADSPAPATLSAAAGGQKPLGQILPVLSSRLELRGSRGETLNFMLRATEPDCRILRFSPWSRAARAGSGIQTRLTGAHPGIRLYRMATIPIKHQSFPGALTGPLFDPLIPQDPGRLCPEGGAPVWLWGDLEIPTGLPPGRYGTELRLGAGARVPVDLTVWKMVMPEEPALPAYAGLSSWYALLGHYGKWHEGEERLDSLYAAEMTRHRLIPIQNWVARPEVVTHGDRPMLDLANRPTPAQSFARVVLAHRPGWAYFDFPTVPPEDIDKPATLEYFRAIENSLSGLKRPGRALVYLWDEPPADQLAKLVRFARLVRRSAPDLKILVTTPPRPELEPYVDIFVPVMDQFAVPGFPDESVYSRLQKQGHEIWWYISCMSHGCDALADSGRPDFTIERPATWVRAISWISARYSINAFLYYAVVEGYHHYPGRDPWKSLWDFSGNGDGTLFYPGRAGEHGFTRDEPVDSIRLKLWRESSFDAEYIRWMRSLPHRPAWWDNGFSRLVRSTTDWEKDYGRYQELRDRAGEYLNGETGAGNGKGKGKGKGVRAVVHEGK